MARQLKSALIVFALVALGCASLCPGQTPLQAPVPDPAGEQRPDPRLPGSISGTVLDGTGAVVAGARVTLTKQDQSPDREALSGEDGQFSFTNVPPGSFGLTITAAGFATQTSSGTLRPGELHLVPPIALAVAEAVTNVQVALSAPEVAEAQVKDEEKQRVLGVIPNFYVTYDPHPVALNARQKFELAWRMSVDPFTFGVIGAIAGIQQAQNDFSAYGQGAEGYAKRYGASYANVVSGTFIGSAILPSLLKQDPRYYYKGTGSRRSRFMYALANAVVCKGDNGHWQANYSNILGNLAAGGISNLYYPAEDRNGAALTFENGLIGLAATGAANVFQEFFVRKFTRGVQNHDPAMP
jgi:hypothetical protein